MLPWQLTEIKWAEDELLKALPETEIKINKLKLNLKFKKKLIISQKHIKKLLKVKWNLIYKYAN